MSNPCSRRDVPVSNYRLHTLHCAKNVVVCKECDLAVPRAEADAHNAAVHALKVCDQCGIRVEARKLHDHRVKTERRMTRLFFSLTSANTRDSVPFVKEKALLNVSL